MWFDFLPGRAETSKFKKYSKFRGAKEKIKYLCPLHTGNIKKIENKKEDRS